MCCILNDKGFHAFFFILDPNNFNLFCNKTWSQQSCLLDQSKICLSMYKTQICSRAAAEFSLEATISLHADHNNNISLKKKTYSLLRNMVPINNKKMVEMICIKEHQADLLIPLMRVGLHFLEQWNRLDRCFFSLISFGQLTV